MNKTIIQITHADWQDQLTPAGLETTHLPCDAVLHFGLAANKPSVTEAKRHHEATCPKLYPQMSEAALWWPDGCDTNTD